MRIKTALLGIFAFQIVSVVSGQEPERIFPNAHTTFALKQNEKKLFTLSMKAGDYAELDWLTSDSAYLTVEFLDSSGHLLEKGNIFVAPKDGTFRASLKLETATSDNSNPDVSHKITVQYKNKFVLPRGSKEKEAKIINGYDIRIYETPLTAAHVDAALRDEDEDLLSIVVFKKGGILKRVFKDAATRGYSFNDPYWDATPSERKKLVPVQNYLDKTGDGIADVAIVYNSHVDVDCCWITYVVNLGETPDLVVEMDQGMRDVVGINPKGGIRFRVRETAFDGWNGGYSPESSDDPQEMKPIEVVLEFQNGRPHPNFALLKKSPPSLSTLARKARVAGAKMNLAPTLGLPLRILRTLKMFFQKRFGTKC